MLRPWQPTPSELGPAANLRVVVVSSRKNVWIDGLALMTRQGASPIDAFRQLHVTWTGESVSVESVGARVHPSPASCGRAWR
jgi:hypothetical protein